MLNTSRTGTGTRRHSAGRRAVAGIAVILALTAVSCGGDDDGLEKNAEGYKVEPAGEVGPNAFTPSVASTDIQSAMGLAPVDGGESAQAASSEACNTDKFLTELQSRPDAYREWAKVLGLKPEQVPAYIKSLKSTTLTSDTKVTNHGLKDGKAYPRASVLTAGTAVLVDASPEGPVASTTSAVPTTSTATGTVVIVTRCKCGNPLLPPPADPEKVDEETPVTDPPGTTPGSTPGSVAPASTRATTTAPSTTRSSTTATTRSSTSTSGGGATTSTTG